MVGGSSIQVRGLEGGLLSGTAAADYFALKYIFGNLANKTEDFFSKRIEMCGEKFVKIGRD